MTGKVSGVAETEDETTAELEGESLQQGWADLAANRQQQQPKRSGRRPQRHAQIIWAARTDIGRARENNEDKFDFFLPDQAETLATHGRLWAIADGMGGHAAGQVASEFALKTLVRAYFEPSGNDVGARLRAAIGQANELLARAAREFPDKNGMGTTLVAAVVREDVLTVAHVGDSRAYLLRDKTLRQITTDHSWVEEQVRSGSLTRAQAETSPYRNHITRSVGMGAGCEADIVTETLRLGDTLLLCSDGLSGYLDGEPLARLLAVGGPSQIVLNLIDAANGAGGRDNITALILQTRGIVAYDAITHAGTDDDAAATDAAATDVSAAL